MSFHFLELSSASLSKIRHVAGACLHKIITRLRLVVTRNMGKMGKDNKLERDWNYKLHRLLKGLRISEECALETPSTRESMYEIKYKQVQLGACCMLVTQYLCSLPMFIFLSKFTVSQSISFL